RWIQEHYTYDFDQETFSYYGPINLVALNMGYRNEHHDLPSIPWNNLPKLRAMAPEFYNNLKFHSSWSRLLFQFIFDRRYSLYSRVERTESDEQHAASTKVRQEAGSLDLSARPISFYPWRINLTRAVRSRSRPSTSRRKTKRSGCSTAISWN